MEEKRTNDMALELNSRAAVRAHEKASPVPEHL